MLRKHERSRGTYLQIVESFWDAEQGKTRKRSGATSKKISFTVRYKHKSP